MRYILLAVVILLMLSCYDKPLEKTERPGEPDIISLQSDDNEMNMAIETARITLNKFDSAVHDSLSDKNSFALKLRFATENTTEHIWFTEIQPEDSAYTGILNNVPSQIQGIKFGERMRLNRADISDWMY